jgi:hypothetical protein
VIGLPSGRSIRWLLPWFASAAVAGFVASATSEAVRFHRSPPWFAVIAAVAVLGFVAVAVLFVVTRRRRRATGARPKRLVPGAVAVGCAFIAAALATSGSLFVARGTMLPACGWISPGEVTEMNRVDLGSLSEGLDVEDATCDESQPSTWERRAVPRISSPPGAFDAAIRRARSIGWRPDRAMAPDGGRGVSVCLRSSTPGLRRASMEMEGGTAHEIEHIVLDLDDREQGDPCR